MPRKKIIKKIGREFLEKKQIGTKQTFENKTLKVAIVINLN